MNLAPSLRRKLGLLKWLIPFSLVLVVIAYEFGPARWIHSNLGFRYHLVAESLFFGTFGPLLAFLVLELLSRWIEAREIADVRANLLAEARKKDQEVRQLSDDTIQVLFATSLLITNIKADGTLPPDAKTQIKVTEKALDESIQRLRFLLSD